MRKSYQTKPISLSSVLEQEDSVPYLVDPPIRNSPKAMCFKLPRQSEQGVEIADCWIPKRAIREVVNDCLTSEELGKPIYLVASWMQLLKMREGFYFPVR